MDPALISLIAQITPVAIQGIRNLFGGGQSQFQPPPPVQMPEMAPAMTWEQALAQTQGQMAPLMRQYDNQAMARGFYGQMPTDVARSDYASVAQSQMANQLMQQDWANKFGQQQMAADFALKQGQMNLGGLQLQQQQQQHQANQALGWSQNLGNWYTNMAQLTGQMPFSGQWTNQRKQQMADELADMSARSGYRLTV